MKYVNETGLQYFYNKIKNKLNKVDQLSEEIADLKANGSGATEEQIRQIETNKNDIAEIKEDLIELSQIEAPEIVSSVDEMIDTTKHYVLDGYIYQDKEVTVEGETIKTYPNVFVPSTAQLNKRYSTSGDSLSNRNGYFWTDFIETPHIETTPYNMRLNWEMALDVCTDCKLAYYTANGTRVGYSFISEISNAKVENGETVIDLKTIHIQSSSKPSNWADVAKVRLQLAPKSSEVALVASDLTNLKITLDAVYTETTTEPTTKNEWVNTGISYAPTFKTDLVGVLGENNVIYLSDNLPSGTYTLKYPDDNYATIGTISK